MYPYHNRINAGEMVDFYFTNDYPKIGEALVLVFSTWPIHRPIRPKRWPEYEGILKKWREKHDAE